MSLAARFMKLSPFASELLDSILVQVENFHNGRVTRRVTTRILRVTMRRLDARLIGRSCNLGSNRGEFDHAVPLAVITERILSTPHLDRSALVSIFSQWLVSVELTKEEHREILTRCKLSRCMPLGWDGVDVLARYHASGIQVHLISGPSLEQIVLNSSKPSIAAAVDGDPRLKDDFTLELPFPVHSEFFNPIDDAVSARENQLDDGIEILLKPGGYKRTSEVLICTQKLRTFLTNFKGDSSRFSTRLRAAAAILRKRNLLGRFQLAHDNGKLTIRRVP